MKNLLLYENFEHQTNPEFSELLPKLLKFFPDGGDPELANPNKYVLFGGVNVYRRAKPPGEMTEVFSTIINYLDEEKYDYQTFPVSVGKGMDFRKFQKILKSVGYNNKMEEGLDLAIAIPTRHSGKNYDLILSIEPKATYFRLYEVGKLDLISYKTEDPHKGLKALLWTGSEFVSADFIFGEIILQGQYESDGATVEYIMTNSSNGRKYYLEMGAYLVYKDEIEELEDVWKLKDITV